MFHLSLQGAWSMALGAMTVDYECLLLFHLSSLLHGVTLQFIVILADAICEPYVS